MHAYFQVSIDALDGSKEPVIVGYDQSTVGIFENGEVAVYATLRGTQTGDNLFGGKTTEPLLIADVVDVATNSGTVS